MSSRTVTIERNTTETQIWLELNLDGSGRYELETGIGFFDHMLSHLAKHGGFDLKLKAVGDLHIDDHHTVEDVGITLGQAFSQALGDKRGITRYGSSSVPMDEVLANCAVDLSGRPYLVFNAEFSSDKIGAFDTQLTKEFTQAFVNNAMINLHINVPYGSNDHHIAEGIFKALGRALAQAVAVKPGSDQIPSTKGVL